MSLSYRPEIDGLRALAVVPVVLYHSGIPGIPGGYVGVDIFFVISGFLITAIIVREVSAGAFSVLSFYERRARRILPALTVMALATLAVGFVIQSPARYEETAVSAAATAAFLSNVYFFQRLDYFSVGAEYYPLLHTWSLAVEEQFYLIWPVVLLLLGATRIRARAALVILAIAASLMLSISVSATLPEFSFYLLPTRLWELMLGAALALGLVPAPRSRALAEAAGAVGVALIAFAVFTFDATTPFPGAAALAPCLGAALIIWSGGGTWVGRILSQRPLVFIGLISYSLYLWHWPPLAFLKAFNGNNELPLVHGLAIVTAAFGVAVLSWRFVERPFRNRTAVGRRAIFALSAISIAGLIGLGGVVKLTDGAAGRFDPDLVAAFNKAQRPADFDRCDGRTPADGLCRVGLESEEPSVLVWGDSHVAAALAGFDAGLSAAGQPGVVALHFGCPPVPAIRRDTGWQRCAQFNDAILTFLIDPASPIDTVILHARWALTATGTRAPGEGGPPVTVFMRDGTVAASNAEVLELGLNRLADQLAAAGLRVVLVGGSPEFGLNVPDQWLMRETLGFLPTPTPTLRELDSRNADVDRILRTIAAQANFEYIPLLSALCIPNCMTHQGLNLLYWDDNHISRYAAETLVAPLLEAALFATEPRPTDLNGADTPEFWRPSD